jgi:hypothetical protein
VSSREAISQKQSNNHHLEQNRRILFTTADIIVAAVAYGRILCVTQFGMSERVSDFGECHVAQCVL